MTIGIYENLKKDTAPYYVDRLTKAIEMGGSDWFLLNEEEKQADLYISVGGDGTFLKAAKYAFKYDVPVLGLNLGTFGLLTEVDKDNAELCIKRIAEGEYDVEERTVLEVFVEENKNGEIKKNFVDYGINDCVLTQLSLLKASYVRLTINNSYVETYPCDGIIVSTQTGSTAYSLSAGGPIVMPGCDVILVTPKCPHFTDGRSIVADKNAEVRLNVVKENHEMIVSVDGEESYKLKGNETIVCKNANKKLKIIRMNPPDFFAALNSKIEARDRLMGIGKGVI
ncbi:MAG: NAD(+)/NADH kinase [Ruminococcaceae bacterium]|nr:NAD(+)/NADH kinase [Oscillospiraceae bacterium]